MGVSQKQIAEKLGVSISVVSRVLSGRAKEIGIAENTITLVKKTAKEMNYVSNAAARALKGKSTQTIGVVVYDFNDPFFGTIVEKLHRLAYKYEYSLLLVGFQNRIPTQRDLSPFHKFALDGIIAVGSDSDESWLKSFNHLPCARIGYCNGTPTSHEIGTDEKQGYDELLRLCVRRGVDNLVFLGDNSFVHIRRKEALEELCNSYAVKFKYFTATETYEDPFECGVALSKKCLSPNTTIICANDRMAMGAIHTCLSNNLSVPEDIKVVGFDDIPLAEQFIPPLTTIRQPINRLTESAFNYILKKDSNSESLFQSKLILRKTF
jgi:DNA-binding LacI/PurR family transcriptional regulator